MQTSRMIKIIEVCLIIVLLTTVIASFYILFDINNNLRQGKIILSCLTYRNPKNCFEKELKEKELEKKKNKLKQLKL